MPIAQIPAALMYYGEPSQEFSGELQFFISGTSHVNAIGIAPLAISAFWANLQNGTSAFSYSWTGSAATLPATTSQVTITVSGASGVPSRRVFSAVITDALQKSIQQQFYVTITHTVKPTPFDGNIVTESQARRRVFPV